MDTFIYYFGWFCFIGLCLLSAFFTIFYIAQGDKNKIKERPSDIQMMHDLHRRYLKTKDGIKIWGMTYQNTPSMSLGCNAMIYKSPKHLTPSFFYICDSGNVSGSEKSEKNEILKEKNIEENSNTDKRIEEVIDLPYSDSGSKGMAAQLKALFGLEFSV